MSNITHSEQASFDAIVSAWDDTLRCQSVHTCSRPARWIVGYHRPCGDHTPQAPTPLCTFHRNRWRRVIADFYADEIPGECGACGRWCPTVDQLIEARPL